ncbi:MAG: hypothetical protein LBD12_02355 [Clostridiales Family XIII bacterium]|jgi:hypothetical protein|nr:hypothetical protein [Clostridiales Family XIII bacterium]
MVNEKGTSGTCNCSCFCLRHGKCCECVAYHRRAGEFPACFFSVEAEKTYDRSLKALIDDREL